MTIFNKVQTKVDIRIQELAEIISELRDPLYSTQTQEMLQQQPPQQEQQLETAEEEEDERMDITSEGMTEEELKRVQAEAKRNEESLRKKRVRDSYSFISFLPFKITNNLYMLYLFFS
jgi:hypothetical protein